MREPLRHVADIRVGYSFRTKIESDPAGDVHVLQISDIRNAAALDPQALPLIKWPVASQPPLLRPGDVVIPARGDHYEALVIQSDEPMVASGQLFVIELRTAAVLPDYLCWFLNRPESRNYILKNRAGSSIPSLSRPVLGDLPITIPALETQKKILALAQLWQQEQLLSQRLLVNRQKMLEGIYSKLLES
ncbi:restriction endonuclease subunit S [Luteibacter yeojuensis]